ncbi:MarR family winged helix-turn-helix transcriptional regulator [Actinocorallia sp. A-T 12471]|uniref:MarR family winged helix-turn-helix transcriptional regulator n=1 Tax=Actinocorallia sp. A-T 12471 TaxID=3089813 RepID=UPI0029CD27F9|nr:MarR family transcriptional regulator [Actinocorallia sp. A-T 12471]MDX6740080.1 MarR family transcriptional regulator [Actinocorallia sp. A-T 12471]
MSTPPSDLELWFALKRAHEVVRARVLADVAESSGLSEPDLVILVQLDKAGGRLRQSELAAALGWDRTRLSHQLTRMASRDLLTRDRGATVTVALTEAAHALITALQPRLESAVQRHFTSHLTPAERQAIGSALSRL